MGTIIISELAQLPFRNDRKLVQSSSHPNMWLQVQLTSPETFMMVKDRERGMGSLDFPDFHN